MGYPDLSPAAMGKGYPKFVEEYKQAYGEAPISGFHANAYDGAMLAIKAIEKVGKTDSSGDLYIGKKALRDAVFSTSSTASAGRSPATHTASARSSTVRCCSSPRPIRRPSASGRTRTRSGRNDAAAVTRSIQMTLTCSGPKRQTGCVICICRMAHAPIVVRARGSLPVDVVSCGGFGSALSSVVVGGTIGSLIKDRYTAAQWFDFVLFGLTIGSIYAQIALGYTMVYGVLRLINFAHGDFMMCGAFAGYFIATPLENSGFLDIHPVLGMAAILAVAMAVSTVIALLTERIAYRPFRRVAGLAPLICAFGVSFFLEQTFRGMFGSAVKAYPTPSWQGVAYRFGSSPCRGPMCW